MSITEAIKRLLPRSYPLLVRHPRMSRYELERWIDHCETIEMIGRVTYDGNNGWVCPYRYKAPVIPNPANITPDTDGMAQLAYIADAQKHFYTRWWGAITNLF